MARMPTEGELEDKVVEAFDFMKEHASLMMPHAARVWASTDMGQQQLQEGTKRLPEFADYTGALAYALTGGYIRQTQRMRESVREAVEKRAGGGEGSDAEPGEGQA